MSVPGVSTTITGMDKPEIVEQNLKIAQGFTPMGADEMDKLRARAKQYAGDGRFELYKTSIKFDNPETRLAHDFPQDLQSIETRQIVKMTINNGKPFPEVEDPAKHPWMPSLEF